MLPVRRLAIVGALSLAGLVAADEYSAGGSR